MITIKLRGSWCYEEEERILPAVPTGTSASATSTNTTITPLVDDAPPTLSERKQWKNFVKTMLDTLLPYREAYTAVRRLIDDTLAASPAPAPG